MPTRSKAHNNGIARTRIVFASMAQPMVDHEARTGLALVFTAAFTSLIFFNDVQTTFFPVLAARAKVRT
jgi:hypothetical protein